MADKLRIGIVGHCGVVGRSMLNFFLRRRDLYETHGADIQVIGRTVRGLAADCELLVICVPTPAAADGSCDLSAVEEVFKELRGFEGLVVLRSTVPPGTSERLATLNGGLNVVFSPEFISESKYWTHYGFEQEVVATPWFVFGGAGFDGRRLADRAAQYWIPVAGPNKQYLLTDAKTAELVKLWSNSYFATKVMLCNQMADLCDKLGVSWTELRELWTADPRVDRMHTAVFRSERGYGGKCFPKDVQNLLSIFEQQGANGSILEAVHDANGVTVSNNDSLMAVIGPSERP